MLAFHISLCLIEKTIPPSRPAVLGARRRVAVKEGRSAIARRRVAVKEGRSAIAKRRDASLRAIRCLATLARAGVRSCLRFPRSWETPPVNHRVMTNPGTDRRRTACNLTEPTPFNRA
jgi:hypothetical protein